jgi:4-hydroxybenzoate polyprenyltransferase
MASDPEHWPEAAKRSVEPGEPRTDLVGRLVGRTWRTLEYSSAYLALIGAAEALIVTYLLSLAPNPAPLVVALVTFAVYANDRLVDVESDGVSNPRRTAFVRRYRRELYVLAAIAYGAAVALSAFGGPLAFAIALLPGGAWLVYAIDWMRVPAVRFDRLKEVPFVSSLVVSIAWALAIVLLPVAFAGAAITPTVTVLFAYFALATFVNAEVANVRDVESDTANGVATMATVLGTGRTRTVLYAVSVLTGALLGAAAAFRLLAASSAAVLALGIAVLLVVVALVGRVDDGKALTLAAECSRLPVFAALVALTLL